MSLSLLVSPQASMGSLSSSNTGLPALSDEWSTGFEVSRSSLTVPIIPLHDFIVFLNLLFDMRQLTLQVLTALLLLEESGILGRQKLEHHWSVCSNIVVELLLGGGVPSTPLYSILYMIKIIPTISVTAKH